MRADFDLDLDLDRSDRWPAGISRLIIGALMLITWVALIGVGYGLMAVFS